MENLKENNEPEMTNSANNLLKGFNGSEIYYRHFFGYIYTDGVQYMAEKFGAYWLIDLVISHQTNPLLKVQPFQTWDLKKVKGTRFCASCTDGNNNLLVSQYIPFSDFPYDVITLWLVDNVLMLPSEY